MGQQVLTTACHFPAESRDSFLNPSKATLIPRGFQKTALSLPKPLLGTAGRGSTPRPACTFLRSAGTCTLVYHCSWFLYLCVSAVSVPRGNKGRGKSLLREGSLGLHFQNPLPHTQATSFPRGSPGKLSETSCPLVPAPSQRQRARGCGV